MKLFSVQAPGIYCLRPTLIVGPAGRATVSAAVGTVWSYFEKHAVGATVLNSSDTLTYTVRSAGVEGREAAAPPFHNHHHQLPPGAARSCHQVMASNRHSSKYGAGAFLMKKPQPLQTF